MSERFQKIWKCLDPLEFYKNLTSDVKKKKEEIQSHIVIYDSIHKSKCEGT